MHDESTVQIPLRARDGTIRAYALVDASDAEWANQWTWRLYNTGYAARCERDFDGRLRAIMLHRELLGLADGNKLTGDHVNRDRLDNRRANLRSMTKAAQRQNVTSARGATSRFLGVSWHPQCRRWRAKVTANGKQHYLGLFDTEEAAAEAALQGRRRLMPFAVD
jgi:hypothetical protein